MKKNNKLTIAGAITLAGSFLFAFSPLALAYFSTPAGGNMWSEGGNGGGTAIWLMLFTLPLGFLTGVTGLVLLIVGLVQKSKNKN
jgi:hypothetical protein